MNIKLTSSNSVNKSKIIYSSKIDYITKILVLAEEKAPNLILKTNKNVYMTYENTRLNGCLMQKLDLPISKPKL